MIGKELQEWRRKWGLSQEGLAQRLGVIRVTVARWETRTRAIPAFLPLALEALENRMEIGGGGKMKAIKAGKKWGILENILFETKAEAERHIEQIQETLMKACKIVNAFEALPEQEKARLEAQSEIDKALMHLPEGWKDIIH